MRNPTSRVCAYVLAFWLAILPHHAVHGQERRFAVVIGNDSYQRNMKLSAAVNDAKLVGDALEETGFEVTRILDATKNQMASGIESVTKRLGRDDLFLLYFAGHGIERRGINFLVPIDVPIGDNVTEREFFDSTISLSSLMGKVKQAAVSIWIFDACRDDPFSVPITRSLGSSTGPDAHLENVTDQMDAGNFLAGDSGFDEGSPVRASQTAARITGSLVMYSSASGRCPFETPTSPVTVFARSLAAQIRLGQDVEAASKAIRREVAEQSKGLQIPHAYSSLIGDVEFKTRK